MLLDSDIWSTPTICDTMCEKANMTVSSGWCIIKKHLLMHFSVIIELTNLFWLLTKNWIFWLYCCQLPALINFIRSLLGVGLLVVTVWLDFARIISPVVIITSIILSSNKIQNWICRARWVRVRVHLHLLGLYAQSIMLLTVL